MQIIKQAVNILRNRAPNDGPATLTKRQALWVLAHLVGDIHQPLHVGAIYFDRDCEEVVDPNVVGSGKPDFGIGSIVASTNGGNDIHLPNGKSFHVTYWDDGTVKGAMRLPGIKAKSIEDFAAAIVANPPARSEEAFLGDDGTAPDSDATGRTIDAGDRWSRWRDATIALRARLQRCDDRPFGQPRARDDDAREGPRWRQDHRGRQSADHGCRA